jgi:quercetin dioxygenase-like cupin family protein
MTETVLDNPVTHDVVTLHTPGPTAARDRLVFTTVLPGGAAGSPPHRHDRLTEVFEVLGGHVTFRVGKTEHILGAGETVTIRPGTVHGFRNASDAPAVLRCTVTPGAGFERFLRGMQAAAEARRTNAAGLPRDPRRLARLLLDADFHFPGLPMPLQRGLFRALAAFAPTSIT